MNERGSLERDAVAFAAEVDMCQPPQFGIDDRQKRIERFTVTVCVVVEQPRDFATNRCLFFTGKNKVSPFYSRSRVMHREKCLTDPGLTIGVRFLIGEGA